MVWFTRKWKQDNIFIYEFGKECTDKELEEYFISYKNFLNDRKDEIIIIFDMLNIEKISIRQMWRNISFINSMKSIHREKLDKFILVFKSNFIKRITEITFKISPPVVPYYITTTLDDAHNNIS